MRRGADLGFVRDRTFDRGRRRHQRGPFATIDSTANPNFHDGTLFAERFLAAQSYETGSQEESEPCLRAINRSIPINKSGRQSTLRKDMKSAGWTEKEAERRAWATVNKESGGGNKSGSGRGQPDTKVSSKKGGKKGGAVSASRSPEERSASAKKAAATRKRNQAKAKS